MLDIILGASKNTLIHLLLLFGLTGFITLLLFLLQRMICISFSKTTGWNGLYLTAWIGTPVHEMGHVVFCLLFGHKVNEVALFKPDKSSGVLGYVHHSYNTKSLYQSIGNFFIGIAPLLTGSAVLFLLFDTFFQGHAAAPLKPDIDINNINASIGTVFNEVYSGIKHNLSAIQASFTKPTLTTMLLVYVMTSISTHMAPSNTDLKNALPGFGLIVALIFIFNLVMAFTGKALVIATPVTAFMGKLHGILIFGLALTIVAFVLIYLPLAVYHLFRAKRILNPFY